MKHYGHQVYKGIFEISEQPQFLTTEPASLPSGMVHITDIVAIGVAAKTVKKQTLNTIAN